MHFVYVDNSKTLFLNQKWEAPIVFECDAKSITEADELYAKTIGVLKQYIGCKSYA